MGHIANEYLQKRKMATLMDFSIFGIANPRQSEQIHKFLEKAKEESNYLHKWKWQH
jgi:hypothetical protein